MYFYPNFCSILLVLSGCVCVCVHVCMCACVCARARKRMCHISNIHLHTEFPMLPGRAPKYTLQFLGCDQSERTATLNRLCSIPSSASISQTDCSGTRFQLPPCCLYCPDDSSEKLFCWNLCCRQHGANVREKTPQNVNWVTKITLNASCPRHMDIISEGPGLMSRPCGSLQSQSEWGQRPTFLQSGRLKGKGPEVYPRSDGEVQRERPWCVGP